MSTECVSARVLARYGSGQDLPPETVWVLEAHLERCPSCRQRLGGPAADPGVLALVESVRSAVEPRLGPGHGLWWGWRHRLRRGMARWSTPAALPWLATAVFVPLAAMTLDLTSAGISGEDGVPLVLLVAPVIPALAVAAAWNRWTDRAYELVSVTARAGLSLLLRRTLAALLVILPPLAGAGAVVGASPSLWLLPGLALTIAVLALGAVIGVGRATGVLAGVWILAVILPALVRVWPPVALEPGSAPVWAAVIVVGGGLLLRFRDGYQQNNLS